MLHFIYGDQLTEMPELASAMFQARARQFRDRLGWDVTVNDAGEERDQYDALNPLYVIVTDDNGHHQGSYRLMPTTGRTMLNEHFQNVTGGELVSPLIWECTRFCLDDTATRETGAILLLAGAHFMAQRDIDHLAGVFDPKMVRIYKLLGATPEILGTADHFGETVHVGLWQFDETHARALERRAKMKLSDIETHISALHRINAGPRFAPQIQYKDGPNPHHLF